MTRWSGVHCNSVCAPPAAPCAWVLVLVLGLGPARLAALPGNSRAGSGRIRGPPGVCVLVFCACRMRRRTSFRTAAAAAPGPNACLSAGFSLVARSFPFERPLLLVLLGVGARVLVEINFRNFVLVGVMRF